MKRTVPQGLKGMEVSQNQQLLDKKEEEGRLEEQKKIIDQIAQEYEEMLDENQKDYKGLLVKYEEALEEKKILTKQVVSLTGDFKNLQRQYLKLLGNYQRLMDLYGESQKEENQMDFGKKATTVSQKIEKTKDKSTPIPWEINADAEKLQQRNRGSKVENDDDDEDRLSFLGDNKH